MDHTVQHETLIQKFIYHTQQIHTFQLQNVQFNLEQAMKAQWGSKSKVLLFL
jgi:hypothetical protein